MSDPRPLTEVLAEPEPATITRHLSDDAWAEWRRGHIGGSDIATVAGLNPWGSRWALWQEKRGFPSSDEPTDNDREQRFRLAHDHEATVAREFHLLTDLWIAGEQTSCECPDHPHHGCTVDGFVVESPDSPIDAALGVAEIKTTGSRAPWRELPDHVLAQIQWQLHVTRFDRAWCPVMFGGQRVRVYEVDRDEADIAALVDVADRFWADVCAGRPPTPAHQDLTALQARYPEASPGSELSLDADGWNLLHMVSSARAATRTMKKREEALLAQLIEIVGDAETLTHDGRVVATYRTASRSSIDAKALRAEHPDLAEQYQRHSSYRTLRIKDES